MKNAVLAVFTLVAMLGASAPLRAATVHPFEAPPTLSEPGPRLAPQALGGAPAPCNPQGSLLRNGSIVSVQLNFILGNFTINNPDPTDPQDSNRYLTPQGPRPFERQTPEPGVLGMVQHDRRQPETHCLDGLSVIGEVAGKCVPSGCSSRPQHQRDGYRQDDRADGLHHQRGGHQREA